MSQDKSDIEQLVTAQVTSRGGSIRNRAALGAIVKLIPVVGDGLYHALTAGSEAVKDEKQQLQIDLLCQLVAKIDQSISEMLEEAKAHGAPFVEIGGTINVRGERAESVVGLEVSPDRSATIRPGTVVNVDGRDAQNIIGVKI